MAILESPENGGATATTMTAHENESSDLNLSLRRRPTASLNTTVTDSSSKTSSSEDDYFYGDSSRGEGDAKKGCQEGHDRGDGAVNAERIENHGNRVGSDARFTFRPSVPAHRRIKESPLSSDAIFKQYGLLIRTGFWFSSSSLRDWPLFMCCLTLPIFPLAAFLFEKLAQKNLMSEPVVVLLHVLNTTAAVLYPVLVILRCDSVFMSGVTLMLFACIVWLKLVSYAHTNYDIRALAKSVEKISYPRTSYIRKGWVVRQFVKLIIFTGLMGFVIEQYINPIVQNSQHPLKGNLLYAVERVLKLSVPNLYVWLCMFYCFFHLWLNILAELLCFGDREFYKDCWNAKAVEEYWRMWNMPVHKWIVRHIYFPCLRNGIPKGGALLIAFLVSAIFHEVPLVLITSYLQNKLGSSMVGNMMFWFFFCILGQPMCASILP